MALGWPNDKPLIPEGLRLLWLEARVAENHHSAWNRPVLTRPKPSLRQVLTGTLAGPVALLGIVVLFYWKLVLTDQYTWLERPDLSYLVLPWLQFQGGEWHAGRFPLWDPNSWFGQPLFGQAQPGAAYPLNWLLFIWPLKDGWLQQSVLHWYFVLIHYLAAVNAYALCRSLGRSRKASVVGGCVYALGGYVAVTDWPQMLNGAVWTPLVFLFLLKAERGERPWSSALLSGFFLGFGWLAGHHQMNLFVTLAAVGLWGWLALRERRIDWRIVKLAAASLAIAFCASAFQTLPMAEYGRVAVRWSGAPNDPLAFNQKVPYSVHEQYALKPENLLGIFLPGAAVGSNPYVGATALALAVLGFALAWRTKQVRWLAAVGLGGLLFALGGDNLFHGILYSLVPLVEKARVPGAGTLLLSVALAPLVAYGIDLVPVTQGSTWTKRVSWVLAGIALVILGVAIVGYLRKLPELENRILLTALAAGLAAAILVGWRSGILSATLGAVAALGLILFELASVTTFYFPNRALPESNRYLHQMREHSDLVDYVKSRKIEGRIYYEQDIPYNIGDWYGIEAMNSYTASVLESVWNSDLFSARGQAFYGVRYHFSKTPRFPTETEVFTGKSGLKVFENRAAFPRVWSVHEVRLAWDVAEARALFRSPEIDLMKTAFVVAKRGPVYEHCAGDDDEAVEMPVHQPNYLRITARMRCRGMVVLTDPYFPGWTATVDGKPAKIEEVDCGVRGVMVDGGSHMIDMKYRPLSVITGGLLGLLAAAICCVAIWVERRGLIEYRRD
jgi:Bacterial membrane protein YfhO